MLESLDANSSYLWPAEYKQFKAQKSDGKGTIGATVSKRFGYAAVVSVIPGGPADKAGLGDADILEAINGKSSRDMSLAEILGVLDGPPGSTVTVSVVRARRAEPTKAVITREVVSSPVTDKMLENGIGYIQVAALTKGNAQELANRVKSLQKAGANKLILDLRDVSAGTEAEGVATANLFLNHGTITYLEGQKDSPRQTFTADPAKAVTSLPMVVLVNRGTGGPAEIVASAIMGNGRGDVVGDKTFGIGSVQKTIEMPDGSALILSVAKYHAPDGKAIRMWR